MTANTDLDYVLKHHVIRFSIFLTFLLGIIFYMIFVLRQLDLVLAFWSLFLGLIAFASLKFMLEIIWEKYKKPK